MDWSKGYSASYYMTSVDPVTWRDEQRIEITGGTIKNESSGLMQSADVKCVNYEQGVERWIRLYLDTRQSGSGAHVAMFTGLATSPDDNIKGTRHSNELQCYSVLKPADDVYLPRGWYVPSGANGTQTVKELLGVSPAPIEVEEVTDYPFLANSIVAEESETRLTMAEKILAAINWRLRILGDGTIFICNYSADPVASFDPIVNDLIETEIKVNYDLFNCPNVYMAISGDLTAIARDDSPDSPLSTVNRGREVWVQETNCNLSNKESLAQYSKRKLDEAQKVNKTASYDRRYVPDIFPTDVVRLHYPAQGLDGLYVVSEQSIELGYGARTSEEILEV